MKNIYATIYTKEKGKLELTRDQYFNFDFSSITPHREDGPAAEWYDGGKQWWFNGKLHREDGPAAEYSDGLKCWYVNGKKHREDGPAVEYSDGLLKCWYINGKRHREDGPAVEYSDGTKEWWLNGKRLSESRT